MSGFLMFSAFNIEVGNPLRKLVLLKLCDNANDAGMCYPSIAHIANVCEMSTRAVQNHIRALEKAGIVKRVERKCGTTNTSNMYLITLPKPKEDTPPAPDAPPYAPDSPPPCTRCMQGVHQMHPESTNKPTSESENIYPAHAMPDDFRLSGDHETIAAARGLDVLAELERFRHYHKSKGAVMVDWGSAFALWLTDTKPKPRPETSLADKDYGAEPPEGFNKSRNEEIPGIAITDFVPDAGHLQQCADKGLDINTVLAEFVAERAGGVSPCWGNAFKFWLARR